MKEVLKPRLLRRMKEDVETIPAKEEVVMWVEMTPEQRVYYRAIYEKQAHVLLAGNKSKALPQMRNLAMELRKVCNHPFLCEGIEDDYSAKRRAAAAAQARATCPLAHAFRSEIAPSPRVSRSVAAMRRCAVC